MLRYMVQTLSGSQAVDLALLEAEAREERAAEAALQQRYPNAILKWNEMKRRAQQHGIKFLPAAQAHHRAAILEFLDNPDAATYLTPMHATWFCAIDPNGRPAGSITHPANLAQFQIIYRYAARHSWTSDHYTAERAQWSVQQWRDYERKERTLRAARPANGCSQITQRTFRHH